MDIGVLGPLEVRADTGGTVPVAGARLRTLLIVLALDANRVLSTDRLIDAVWGDDPPAAAGNALQALVSRLRRTGLVIDTAPTGYRLVIDPERIDAVRFMRLAPARPAEALALWRGELDFPEASRAEATSLTETRRTAHRAVLAEQVRRGADVTVALEALVARHPLDEGFAGLLMRALADQGLPGRAVQVFADLRQRLADTLGTDPAAELAELHLELLRGKPRGNLSASVSSFVGREDDVREIRALVAGHRLVTLTGPGGSGKTRLSMEAGAGVRGEVWQVELAPLTDPAEIPSAVLTALRLRSLVLSNKATVDPLTRLCEALAGREMLILLDNCEHLIADVARVADAILRAAPGLRLLATSREQLGLPGERLRPVEPLRLPPEGAPPEVAAGFPAVRLLLDRAGPGLTLDAATTGPIETICRALDGMPLALELAAARLRTLPPGVVADRLADRFRLLTGGSRAALPRHQTLRAMVDWSWELLTEPERTLWRRFSVFHGGADVTAAERVCGTDIDVLGALVDKSLLVLRAGRFRMLETIREYGLERLAEAGEVEPMRRAHAAHFGELLATAEPHLRRAEQLEWLAVLNAEHDNLHAALRGAVDAGDAATAFALAARLGWYWWLSGHRAEGSMMARDVLAMTGEADREDRATAFAFAAMNGLEGAAPMPDVRAWFREAERLVTGDTTVNSALRMVVPISAMFQAAAETHAFDRLAELFDADDPWLRGTARMMNGQLMLNFGFSVEKAAAELRTALEIFRSIGERWGIGFSLSQLGDLAAAQGDFAQAVRWQREAIGLIREVGIREDIPQVQVKLAHQLWMAGDRAEARRMVKDARESAEEIGLAEVMGSVEYAAATLARLEGDLDAAREHAGRAMKQMPPGLFAPQFASIARSARGLIEAAAGNLTLARRLHTEAVELAVTSSDQPVMALVLTGCADLVLREGDARRAALLLGAADGIRGSLDRSLPDVGRLTAEARAALGDAGFEACYDEGLRVTPATIREATGLHPAAEGPDRQRGEDHQEAARPEQ
ncbi:BTAD domain-containing putative transcriptional regulator [Actinoplanes sp. NPDC089786]|uniref:BTAD domain-containing putative transcriptional regulator n=1 Tax=Actinoplanes sp. NPDC089786 TaxID=3155185 RepID=UPI00342628E2